LINLLKNFAMMRFN